MKKTLILLLAMTFGTVHNFWADTEIYVSPKGNDKASGSFHKPLKTIDVALQKINSIDRCIFDGLLLFFFRLSIKLHIFANGLRQLFPRHIRN